MSRMKKCPWALNSTGKKQAEKASQLPTHDISHEIRKDGKGYGTKSQRAEPIAVKHHS